MNYCSAEVELKKRLAEINLESIIGAELVKKKRCSVYEISDELVAFFNHAEFGQSQIHVGFPFPLLSEDYSGKTLGRKVDLFIRGEPVRKIQRDMLKQMSTSYFEIESGLPKLTKDMGAGKNRVVFVDPYGFIGDSHISLYFADSVRNNFGIKDIIVFSNQSEHLPTTVQSKKYVPGEVVKELKEGDLVIAPDLIDSHWHKTLSLIEELRAKDSKILIPGRNLAVNIIGGKLYTTHLNQEDILLRRKNIEDYMQECIDPFGIKGKEETDVRKFPNTSRYFLNPFTSQEGRYISPELMFAVYKNLANVDKKAEFFFIGGHHRNEVHTTWLNNFISLLKSDGTMRRMGITYYANLSELGEHLQEKECGAVLSADTSIAHIANRLGYPNVTTYNPAWWDADSLQSLSGSSPAGFCRYFHHQLPVINSFSRSVEENAQIIADALRFSQKDTKTQELLYEQGKVNWMEQAYNQYEVVGNISTKPEAVDLVRASLKVSPKYKLERRFR